MGENLREDNLPISGHDYFSILLEHVKNAACF